MSWGAVYVIGCMGVFKIGRSSNPRRRFKEMMLPCEPDQKIVGWSSECEMLEKELHEKFHSKRVYGEWFVLGGEDLIAAVEHIDEFVFADMCACG